MPNSPYINYSATIDDGSGYFYEVHVFDDFSYIEYYEEKNGANKKIQQMQIPTNYAKQIAQAIIALGKRFP